MCLCASQWDRWGAFLFPLLFLLLLVARTELSQGSMNLPQRDADPKN